MNDRPRQPLPTVVDVPYWLHAHGDETQLIVYRSPELRDTDAELYPVVEHIERFGMVLLDRQTRPDPAMMLGKCERSWYTTPQARLGLLAHTDGKLPVEGADR